MTYPLDFSCFVVEKIKNEKKLKILYKNFEFIYQSNNIELKKMIKRNFK